VSAESLHEGQEVITGEDFKMKSGNASNPFLRPPKGVEQAPAADGTHPT